MVKAGGVGLISSAQIGFREADFETNPFEANLRAMEKEYRKAREEAPEGIIGFNIMVALQHYKEYVMQAAKLGADGVQVASVFVATVECDADVGFKQKYVEANEADTYKITKIGTVQEVIENLFEKC